MIPLPIDVSGLQAVSPNAPLLGQLGISSDAAVLLWIGRLSMLLLDPGLYQMLERLAQELDQPLWLVELGPDDTSSKQSTSESYEVSVRMFSFFS